MDWFLYDIGLRRERLKTESTILSLYGKNGSEKTHILSYFMQWPFSQIVDQMRPDQYNKHHVKCYNFRMQIANTNSEE